MHALAVRGVLRFLCLLADASSIACVRCFAHRQRYCVENRSEAGKKSIFKANRFIIIVFIIILETLAFPAIGKDNTT